MGKADAESRNYLSNPMVFADIFNYKLFDGQSVIIPENLQELDPAENQIIDGNDIRVPLQKYRDVLKLWTVFSDEDAVYIVLGVEHQTDIHYAMPVRDMLYDAMNYAGQVEQTRKRYREQNVKDGSVPVKMTGAEFLSGFRKEDKLKPVITLVVYLGAKEWDGPLSIYDMLDVKNKDLLEMDTDSVNLVNVVTESKLTVKSSGGKANMCKGIEDLRAEEREIGKEEATINHICNIMNTLKLTAEQAMDALLIPPNMQKEIAAKLPHK